MAAYPTNALARTLADVDARAASVKDYAARYSAQMAAGPVAATVVVDLFTRLKSDRAAFAAAATVPGLPAYAQAQKNDPTLDAVAAFNGMTGAIDNVTGWITANFPKDANGYLLREQWGALGTVDRTFDANATAGLRAQLAALDATIA